jgi:transcriptional regulator with XRE-family HTH domain
MKEVGRKEDRRRCLNRSIPLPYLRQLRHSRGLSQRELSGLARVSAGTVYHLENNLRGAYPTTVRKLATALGVSATELVREHHPH